MTSEVQARLTPARYIRMVVLDMSQKDLAQAMEVSQPMVAKIERSTAVSDHHRDKYRTIAAMKGREIDEAWFTKVPLTRSARRAVK